MDNTFKGPQAKAIVWAHNSHVGDARATQMSARGELNIGQLIRQKYGTAAYSIGFGTDHGTVTAASEWGGPTEEKTVQPSHIDSYERVCHEVATDNFLLPLRQPLLAMARQRLLPERLERATGNSSFLDLAIQLVRQVHEVLGKHRSDSADNGWLSGLPDTQARQHPTCAGLRIGKPLPERKAGEPADEQLEWQQDGQYFHYLTRWMHALNCTALQTGDATYHHWATELARAAYAAFVYASRSGGEKRMYWKMSIDLSRPLVLSMGHHDPLDGLVFDSGLLEALLADIAGSLRSFTVRNRLEYPAEYRLAFRELGLAIGLQAVGNMELCVASEPDKFRQASRVSATLAQLRQSSGLGRTIVQFWLESAHRDTRGWLDHADINNVMLATGLAPAGYLQA